MQSAAISGSWRKSLGKSIQNPHSILKSIEFQMKPFRSSHRSTEIPVGILPTRFVDNLRVQFRIVGEIGYAIAFCVRYYDKNKKFFLS